jgi:hypothetical protein
MSWSMQLCLHALCLPMLTSMIHLWAKTRFVVQALRHSAATREQVDAAVTSFVGCFGRLWRVPWENGYKEVFWRLAVNGVRAAGACQRYFTAPCLCGVVGSGAHGDCERLRQHAFWECAIAQAVRNQAHRGLGGALLQQWHLWLVDSPPSVCHMVWRVVVLAAIWAMEQGRKHLWSLVHTPPRQGSAVQQAISKASTSFWSALHDFARHNRPVPAKGWDEVGPHHPFLFVRLQIPLRPCIAVAFPP